VEYKRIHITLPSDTKAFICANCGAVSLDPNSICKIQGQGVKADWCGTKAIKEPAFCHNRKNTLRYHCTKCGKTAIHSGLLCEPELLPVPE
jgi:predicted RNA-binding Zn-ribbon protein involved in translation (DUF1610 family)